MWKHVLLSLVFSFVFNVGTVEGAIYTDNFDSYSVGSLVGQGIWTGLGGPYGVNVTATTSSSSPNSITFTTNGGRIYAVQHFVAGNFQIDQSIKYTGTILPSTGVKPIVYSLASATSSLSGQDIVLCPDGRLNDRNGLSACSGGFFSTALSLNTWHVVSMNGIFDGVGYTVTVSLDGVEQWVNYATTTNGFGAVAIGTTNAQNVFVDNFVFRTEGDVPTPPPFDESTRIIDFNPQDGATTTSPVTFSLEAYVNENDIGTVSTIQITLENIDQNVLLLGFLSPSQIMLVDENIESGGFFNYSTTTVVLGDGNYRVEACIKRTFFGGLFGGFFESSLVNLFSDVSDCQSHQFVVGTSTFIGNISQNLWGDTNAFLEGLTATSSEALASTCNPLNLNFDIRQCIVFLTVPDANSLAEVIGLAREGILTRWPWGYGTRFIQILTNSPTSTLPVVVVPILTNTGNDTTLTFDFGDMVAGGGALLDSVSDPVYGKNVRDVFEPFIILFISLLVVIIIVNDLMRIGRDRDSKDIQNNKYH